MLPPNRMTAYKQARAAERPKGMGYTELFFDNVIGLDNDYESTLEDMVDAYNADKMGFLKNAAVGAYEGAKSAVMHPLTTAEGLISGLYDSGANVLSTLGPGGEAPYLDSALMEMYGVTYDQATDEQVSKAREALFGDVANVAGLASGVGAGAKVAGGLRAGSRAAAAEALPEPSFAGNLEDNFDDIDFDDGAFEPDEAYFDAQDRVLAAQTPVEELLIRQAEGRDMTPAELQRIADYEQEQRFLNYDPFAYQPEPEPFGGPMDNNPMPPPMPRMADWDDNEYAGLRELDGAGGPGTMTPEELDRLYQYDTVRYDELFRLTDPTEQQRSELNAIDNRLFNYNVDQQMANGVNVLPPPPAPNDIFGVNPQGFNPPDPGQTVSGISPSYSRLPAVRKEEGIATLYSPSRKAVDLLDRQSYDNLDSLKVQLLNRGAKPDELEDIISRLKPIYYEKGAVSKEDIAESADVRASKLSVVKSYETYSGNFLKGAGNIEANVVEFPLANFPLFAMDHFSSSSAGQAPLMHYRTGRMRSTINGPQDTFHLGEVQSDWAQKRQKLFSNKEDLAAAVDKSAKVNEEIDKLTDEQIDLQDAWIAKHGGLGNEYQSLGNQNQNIPSVFYDPEWQRLRTEIINLEESNAPLVGRIYETKRYGTRDVFDLKYPAPYVGNTRKWVQLALRQSILDAVNSGAKQMTISTGEMVKSYTGGKLEGQQKFYDGTVIEELDDVLKKFAKEAGVKKPEIDRTTIYGNNAETYDVPRLAFTQEFIDAVKRVGLASHAKGGIVQGSLLDVDLFGDGA